ncbi:MAG: ATP synthase F1 subunit delta [Rhodospirillales bacterium]|nr:ATP synthase F1 subunit delta [Rhodospirillales bacterium]
MTHSLAAHSAFAKRYAGAYVDSLAKKDYKSASDEIGVLLSLIEESADIQKIIENPLFSPAAQESVFSDLGKKTDMSKGLVNFIRTLIANNRLSQLPVILEAVSMRLDALQGIVEARVETAYPLSKAQSTELEKEIGAMTGGKAKISVEVKPELMGGLVITIGSKRIDGSIKRRLELLEQDLRAGANENLRQAKTA